MKAWAIGKYGDNSVVRLMSLPDPTIAADEVLIRVKAASINPVDFKIRSGDMRLILKYKFPLVLGNDCAGVVEAIGSQVTSFKIGDEVYTRPHKDRIGTFAELIAAREDSVALKPTTATFEEAASLPLVGLTSWQALIERSHLKAGQRVFIPAGSGGVGTFAIQLAKHFGAFVISNTSTKNVEFVKTLGADQVLDYKTQDFEKVLSNIDIVYDTMGGETQKKAFSVLKPGGVVISIVGPPTAEFAREVGKGWLIQTAAAALSATSHRRARRKHAQYKFLFMLPDGKTLKKIAQLVDEKAIRPVVGAVYPFSEANKALAFVEGGHARGKVVISMA